MSLPLYDLTVPLFIRNFGILSRILEKGRSFAVDNGIAPEELAGARLFEDMAPLTAQIQRCSDTAKFTAVRIGNVASVEMKDEEKTFEDMQERIARTVAFLETIDPATINDRQDAIIEQKTASGVLSFTASEYALNFALPNFFFHMTTAYDILRHKGVPVGKRDYLGRA